MQKQQISINKIIPKNIVPQLQFSVFKIALINKKAANKAISILRQLQALSSGLSYLKRVRNLSQLINEIQCVQILLCQDSQNELLQKILQAFQIQLKQDVLKIISLQIPNKSPVNKQQFSEWSKYWPINFIQPNISKQYVHCQQQAAFIKQKLIHMEKSILLFSDQILLEYHIDEKNQKNLCQKCDYPPHHLIMKIAQSWPKTLQFSNQQKQITKQSYYYFTKLKMLVNSINLCQMCAMGLIHSRLQKLYFFNCFPNQSVQNILYCDKLNHKVEMFEIKINQIQ